ncbi:MAG: PadR family transcriptional regulator [Xanthobacteraceae bacterium]
MGRHRGGRGFGHFKAGFMDSKGRGGAGFRTGRKLASADLQLIILALLAENPSHGYELIKAVEERSDGFYSPSPGMIYPALTYLEEIGYATVEAEGTKKRYRITDAGRRHLDQNHAIVQAMLTELARIGGKMEHVRRVFAGEEPPDTVEDEHFGSRGSEEFCAARRALKMALHEKDRCSPEEAKRIAEILRRAAAEILGK